MVDFKKAKKKDADTISIVQNGDIDSLRTGLNEHFKADISAMVEPIVVSTGILSMDLALGCGGLLGGRVVDISGWEGSGKTLTMMTIAGYIQRCTKLNNKGQEVNKVVAFLDAEGTLSRPFAESAGIQWDKLVVVKSTPDRILSGEDYFEAIKMLVRNGVDFIIVDSCPALTPKQVMSNEVGQGQKATSAQLMAEGLTAITPLVNSSGSIVAFINQMRGKPMTKPYEEKEGSTGGNALGFFASNIFHVARTEPILKQVLMDTGEYVEKKVGVSCGIRIKKNKTAVIPPYQPGDSFHFSIDVYTDQFQDEEGVNYNRGVDILKDYMETGIRVGVINQNSSWFTFGKVKANGRTDLLKQLRANPVLLGEIRTLVLAAIGKNGGMAYQPEAAG